MNTGDLAVWLHRRRIGTLKRDGGRLTFAYDTDYQYRDDATPLSLAMPLSHRTHPDEVVGPWIAGLLPDNDRTLRRWARQMQVADHPFALLSTPIGLDCAGAVQFTRDDDSPDDIGELDFLDEDTIGAQLTELVTASSTDRPLPDAGYFSLGGAQPKIALARTNERWARPSGIHPTTHIIKPASLAFDNMTFNEHLCLQTLRRLGIAAADSFIHHFGSAAAFVSVRYDRRINADGTVIRVHQEDLGQALGCRPEAKYQNEGGPGIGEIVDLLRANRVDIDIDRLLDLIICTWLLAATDLHAKNLSVLLAGTSTRLAPAYDIATALPYYHRRELKLATKIDSQYHVHKIAGRHWQRLAAAMDVDVDAFMARIHFLAEALPSAFDQAVATTPPAQVGKMTPFTTELRQQLRDHLTACHRALDY